MPLLKALCCQLIATALVTLLWPQLLQLQLSGLWLIALQALFAAALSRLVNQPRWWQVIHLLFAPCIWLAWLWSLPTWLYLLAFILLGLVFWGTIQGDVPLFLSSREVTDALIGIIRQNQTKTFIELGAGIGSVVIPLALKIPDLQLTAVERAPLPWLILRWRSRKIANIRVVRQSFWTLNLHPYAMAFAFLSPSVMQRIGDKCAREQAIDSLFISSSFVIPEREPDWIVSLADRRKTRLYGYRQHKTAD